MTTRYRVIHRTEYAYGASINSEQTIAHLLPRDTYVQTVIHSEVMCVPAPTFRRDYLDAFGNRTTYWSIEEPHDGLVVTAMCLVDTEVSVIPPESPAWDDVAWLMADEHSTDALMAMLCAQHSGLAPASEVLASYARPSFPPRRPVYDAVVEFCHRLHEDITFVPGSTDVTTPAEEVLRRREGVCQDFAHLAIGSLRSLGLPARYVSGYVETEAPEGMTKMVGSDASHAWFATFIPGWGWLDLDPTNDQAPPERHVTLAWGRDYTDVAPLRGVLFGPTVEQRLSVSVDVARV